MEVINDRVKTLRKAMFDNGIAAVIVPGTDPHASEYIAACWKDREWISGFNGSAGNVVVARDKAGLWTDSRYFLQAADQLSGTDISLMKVGVPGTPDMIQWLKQLLKKGDKVGVNPEMFSVNAYENMKTELDVSGIELINIDLMQQVWVDRPEMPRKPCFCLEPQYAGKSVAEKLATVRQEMKKNKADVLVLSMLDEIAWLYNVRGNDVAYNPVCISYALVTDSAACFFVMPDKVDEVTADALRLEGVTILPYEAVHQELNKLSSSFCFLFDGSKLNRSLFNAFPKNCTCCNTISPVAKLKSIKNSTEIAGFRDAMVKDGVALTQFFMWLESHVKTEKLNEISVDRYLTTLRGLQPNSVGPSFNSISSYMAHGAVVHYSPTDETAVDLLPDGIYLLDSGGQYLNGTTDITRTISLGNPTAQQRIDFSLVLKGNIALNNVIFPVNTRGSQLDVLARMAMWQHGINYGHGTGHGVGHFLNVHEGPQSIRAEENPVVIEAGMVMSNEPGIYRAGQYGMRTENMMCVVPAFETEFGKFLKFETLTLCYIDQQLMDFTVLDAADVKWIDSYHKKVYETLSPFLAEDERQWLAAKCKPCATV